MDDALKLFIFALSSTFLYSKNIQFNYNFRDLQVIFFQVNVKHPKVIT